jgi:serine protease Do
MKKYSTMIKLGSGLLIGAIGWALFSGSTSSIAEGIQPPELDIDTAPLSREIKIATSFATVVKKASPSVVSIQVIQKTSMPQSPFGDDSGMDPFRRFFSPDAPGQPRGQQSPERRIQGGGSGVIVSEDGFILTNNHVIDGAETITVLLSDDQTKYEAEVLGGDKHSDLAVIKIKADNLEPITLSDSNQLEVGDLVLAMGSPFGLSQSVTMGIVSATGRAGLQMMDIENFIQTDASINPGNSGGALLDAQGRLVGINTLIVSRSGGNQGVGFAIPVNMARRVMEQIVTFGDIKRGLLGISMQEMSESMALQFGLEETTGVLVSETSAGGPADKAGIEAGDVILKFNDTKVRGLTHLKLLVVETRPGVEVDMTVFRRGKSRVFSVEIGALPTDGYMALMKNWGGDDGVDGGTVLQGVAVSNLTPQLREQFGIRQNMSGALITEVDADSKAHAEGLRAGHIILQMEHKSVSDAQDVMDIARGIKGESILLHVWTPNGARFMVVPVD